MSTPLISADELVDALSSDKPPVVLDVRWQLGDPDGYEHFLAGHVPGAAFVDLERELSGPPSSAAGRHPLPSASDFHESVRGWGIAEDDDVVVADATSGMAAARAWWLLRHSGFDSVRVLDGGVSAFGSIAELETGPGRERQPSSIELGWGHMPVIDIDDAANFSGVLLDARAAERYAGTVEPIDPRAGHIPGAVSAPTTGNIGADGRFLPAAELGERFADFGVEETADAAAYCGSGITAAHEILALEIAGHRAALYPGSWSQYSATPRPAETDPVIS